MPPPEVPLPSAWTKAWEFLRPTVTRSHIPCFWSLLSPLMDMGSGHVNDLCWPRDTDTVPSIFGVDDNGANYADYEHGAFQFKPELSVQDAVKNAARP